MDGFMQESLQDSAWSGGPPKALLKYPLSSGLHFRLGKGLISSRHALSVGPLSGMGHQAHSRGAEERKLAWSRGAGRTEPAGSRAGAAAPHGQGLQLAPW